MKLEKKDKLLLIIANIMFFTYIIFLFFWVGNFKKYVEKDYLRSKLVDQIREQTKLTMDSANVSTKDINYIFEIMGMLSYVYLVLFLLLFILIVFLQFKNINNYILGFTLLVYSVAVLIFTLGILCITCIIYFYIGLKLIIKNEKYT